MIVDQNVSGSIEIENGWADVQNDIIVSNPSSEGNSHTDLHADAQVKAPPMNNIR